VLLWLREVGVEEAGALAVDHMEEAGQAGEAEVGVDTELVETSNNQGPVALAQDARSPTM